VLEAQRGPGIELGNLGGYGSSNDSESSGTVTGGNKLFLRCSAEWTEIRVVADHIIAAGQTDILLNHHYGLRVKGKC
jgi:hypothetical protein